MTFLQHDGVWCLSCLVFIRLRSEVWLHREQLFSICHGLAHLTTLPSSTFQSNLQCYLSMISLVCLFSVSQAAFYNFCRFWFATCLLHVSVNMQCICKLKFITFILFTNGRSSIRFYWRVVSCCWLARRGERCGAAEASGSGGAQRVLAWLRDRSDLDPDGQFFLVYNTLTVTWSDDALPVHDSWDFSVIGRHWYIKLIMKWEESVDFPRHCRVLKTC